MRALDVINQLAIRIPQLTSRFTDEVAVNSISRSGTEMTAQCATVHGLKEGQPVAIIDAEMHLVIASLTRAGAVGTLVTTLAHDLTNKIATTIVISGSDEAAFNGTFTRLNVVNRKTITFTMADSGVTTEAGSPVLQNAESFLRGYNRTYKCTSVPSSTSFKFEHPISGLANPTGPIIARVNPRISGAISIERAVAAYTAQEENVYWMFVVIGDVDVSKSRSIHSDATDLIPRSSHYRQQIMQPFAVYVFIPVGKELVGREARDIADYELFRPIARSVLFSKFDSGLYVGAQNPVSFEGHGIFSYDSALYIHQYGFSQVADMYFEDTVGYDDDVAFRNIDFTLDPETGTEDLSANLDLDDINL